MSGAPAPLHSLPLQQMYQPAVRELRRTVVIFHLGLLAAIVVMGFVDTWGGVGAFLLAAVAAIGGVVTVVVAQCLMITTGVIRAWRAGLGDRGMATAIALPLLALSLTILLA